MSLVTQEQCEKWLKYWRKRLVPEWEVQIIWEKSPSPDVRGAIEPSQQYLEAELLLDDEYVNGWAAHSLPNEDPGFEVEAVIVHELLHVLMRDLEHSISLMDDQMHRDVENVIKEAVKHELEGVVERVARALVKERRKKK